ncbi:hypothetical protein ACFSSF_06015 [Dietzia aerolata]|uniref:hypothetical protein n=1 Tax=Dietzia aerolata TaxID=595984 RepID=UPI0036373B91
MGLDDAEHHLDFTSRGSTTEVGHSPREGLTPADTSPPVIRAVPRTLLRSAASGASALRACWSARAAMSRSSSSRVDTRPWHRSRLSATQALTIGEAAGDHPATHPPRLS